MGEPALLANAYKNSLQLAVEHQVETIAFPNISTGVYHFPKEKAAQIAIDTVLEFLEMNQGIKEVVFVCFDDENFEIYKNFILK
jgi:O-acetyl-ADP-ribose deacetylase (regulator of RNase III)